MSRIVGRVATLATMALLVSTAAGCTPQKDAGPTSVAPAPPPATVSAADARAIAKDAYVYGFPIVDNYRVMYSYFVDKDDPEYKGDWNQTTTPQGFTPRPTPPFKRRTPIRPTRRSAPTCAPNRWC